MLSPVNKISVMKYAHLMNRDMLLYYSFFFLKKVGVLTHYDHIAGEAVPWNENVPSYWTIA